MKQINENNICKNMLFGIAMPGGLIVAQAFFSGMKMECSGWVVSAV